MPDWQLAATALSDRARPARTLRVFTPSLDARERPLEIVAWLPDGQAAGVARDLDRAVAGRPERVQATVQCFGCASWVCVLAQIGWNLRCAPDRWNPSLWVATPGRVRMVGAGTYDKGCWDEP